MSVISLDSERTYEVRSLVRLLDAVLESVVAGFDQAGVSLPPRQYWTLGTPAADCEQLVVSLTQCYVGPPGDEATTPQRCSSPISATMAIQVIRCIPSASARGKAPSGEQIQSGASALAIDLWLLLDISRDLDQWDPAGGIGLGVIATAEAGEPEGGFQGVTLQLTLAVP